MKFTRRTYRAARARAIRDLYDPRPGTRGYFWERYDLARRIVERGRRYKGLWRV